MVHRKRVDDDRRRVLPWALLLALLLHAALVPWLVWLFVLNHFVPPIMRQPQRLSIQTSTATVTARKNRPMPLHPAKPHPVVPQHIAHAKPAPPPPHELSQNIRNAPHVVQQPHHPSLGEQLAAQEQQFAREAQQLHAADNPLSIATSVPNPTSIHRGYFDSPANQERASGFMAILSSTQQWFVGNLSCHYAHYSTQFNAGGTEEGDIPWPVCYPRDHDLMTIQSTYRHTISLPVPVPQPGYVLPPGMYITPFLRDIYNQRPQ
ncbi:MAG TPA: hypothetical protein VIJ12_10325 [Candidatus Baltobacteraceae bacterium]